MAIKIVTEYRTDTEAREPGFYNTITFSRPRASGVITTGPHASRPMAKLAAARISVSEMEENILGQQPV